MDAERPGPIAGGCDNASRFRATDRHGFAAQVRIVALFDQIIERIDVYMNPKLKYPLQEDR
jgi:hypothetical protein